MTQISFKQNFHAVLCLDGDLPEENFFKENFSSATILAADGAALKLIERNIFPQYIIGDLDTFSKKYSKETFHESQIIFLPDQETNDFEKALRFAHEKNFSSILICGFHGGELEHTLNNWSVLKKFSSMNLCVYDLGRYGIPLKNSFTMENFPNEIISIVPQPKAKLTTKNLHWELQQEFLELGVREGIRNIAVKENFSIEIHEGEIFLFVDARLPFAPEFK